MAGLSKAEPNFLSPTSDELRDRSAPIKDIHFSHDSLEALANSGAWG